MDIFIKNHLPGNHTDEDLARYRPAVINACNVFEQGLAVFIKSFTAPSDKGTSDNKEQQDSVVEDEGRPKRKRVGIRKVKQQRLGQDDVRPAVAVGPVSATKIEESELPSEEGDTKKRKMDGTDIPCQGAVKVDDVMEIDEAADALEKLQIFGSSSQPSTEASACAAPITAAAPPPR